MCPPAEGALFLAQCMLGGCGGARRIDDMPAYKQLEYVICRSLWFTTWLFREGKAVVNI